MWSKLNAYHFRNKLMLVQKTRSCIPCSRTQCCACGHVLGDVHIMEWSHVTFTAAESVGDDNSAAVVLAVGGRLRGGGDSFVAQISCGI